MNVRRLEIGDIIKTSYNTGPYRIRKIRRGCTCASYGATLAGNHSPSQPHLHLVCDSVDGKHRGFYLNGFDEATLKSVWNRDYLIICKNDRPVQLSMF